MKTMVAIVAAVVLSGCVAPSTLSKAERDGRSGSNTVDETRCYNEANETVPALTGGQWATAVLLGHLGRHVSGVVDREAAMRPAFEACMERHGYTIK